MAAQGARLWLVRHGETDWNAAGRVQGHTPTDLNERGREQARGLGRLLRNHQFAAVYASDLPRARQTAELLVEGAGFSHGVTLSEELRERSFGQYEGHTFEQIRTARTALGLNQTGDLADWTGMPDIEANGAVWERIGGKLKGLSADHPGEDVLVVTHGGVISVAVYKILGIPDGTPRHFPLSNGIMAIVQWRVDGWYLLTLLDLPLAMAPQSVRNEGDTSRMPTR